LSLAGRWECRYDEDDPAAVAAGGCWRGITSPEFSVHEYATPVGVVLFCAGDVLQTCDPVGVEGLRLLGLLQICDPFGIVVHCVLLVWSA
jgi:hypothetical protein